MVYWARWGHNSPHAEDFVFLNRYVPFILLSHLSGILMEILCTSLLNISRDGSFVSAPVIHEASLHHSVTSSADTTAVNRRAAYRALSSFRMPVSAGVFVTCRRERLAKMTTACKKIGNIHCTFISASTLSMQHSTPFPHTHTPQTSLIRTIT